MLYIEDSVIERKCYVKPAPGSDEAITEVKDIGVDRHG